MPTWIALFIIIFVIIVLIIILIVFFVTKQATLKSATSSTTTTVTGSNAGNNNGSVAVVSVGNVVPTSQTPIPLAVTQTSTVNTTSDTLNPQVGDINYIASPNNTLTLTIPPSTVYSTFSVVKIINNSSTANINVVPGAGVKIRMSTTGTGPFPAILGGMLPPFTDAPNPLVVGPNSSTSLFVFIPNLFGVIPRNDNTLFVFTSVPASVNYFNLVSSTYAKSGTSYQYILNVNTYVFFDPVTNFKYTATATPNGNGFTFVNRFGNTVTITP